MFSRSKAEWSGMEVGEMKGRRKLEVGGCPRFAARAPRRRRERRRDAVEERITVIIEDIRDGYSKYINILTTLIITISILSLRYTQMLRIIHYHFISRDIK